jgi:stage II sporulation protein GA (sporulation sigma-E factor processing peptidase)
VLFGTARLSGVRFERLKGLLAAMIGAVYSLIVFADVSKTVFLATKLMVSAIMVLTVFGKRKTGEFIRLLAVFYICGFLFSGFMMLINSVTKTDSFFVRGGIVYFEFSAFEIVVSGAAAFIVTEILRRIFRRGEPEGTFFAKVFYNGKSAVLKGFTDTGNNLSEPISGTPAAITSPLSLKNIIPENMYSAMERKEMSTENRFCLIPCKTVSGTVLISAFRPEKLILMNSEGEFEAEDVVIALSENAPENMLIIGKNLILKEKLSSEVPEK